MATKVIIIPRGTTKWKGHGWTNYQPGRNLDLLCENCGKSWGKHNTMDCPEYTKTVQIRAKPIKSTCVKFQPQVEKELLRLGIKHALLAEMKMQSTTESRLELLLGYLSTKEIIGSAFLWDKARLPISGESARSHWESIKAKARN